jgi:long-chain acyl-CoA synthetase
VSDPRTVPALFDHIVAGDPTAVAYRHKVGGRWRDLTWTDQRDAVARIARALIGAGVAPGEKVAILGSTRLEWVQCDAAIIRVGAVTVGIYHSCLGPDCAYVVDHSEAVLLIVEDRVQLEKVAAHRGAMPRLRQIVVLDPCGPDAPEATPWDDFLAGAARGADAEVERRAAAIAPHDVATLVYTSGTTGAPKGAMLTHANLLFVATVAGDCMGVERQQTTLLFLPLAHVFARLIVYWGMQVRMTIAFAEDLSKVADNLREVRPDFILGVPRVYEKFHERIVDTAERAGGVRERLFRLALAAALAAVRLEQAGRPVPLGLRLRRALADRLVLRKVRAGLGGRLRFCVSGAAALNPAIGEFFLACGIPLIEGIGMTENSSLSNVNPIRRIKLGTVGPVVPGVEMRIGADGEVLFRGPNVMAGYYKDAAATAEAIDAEGWLHSGDIGEIDADGYLRITDRKKDLIVTAGGKNVAPQRIEAVLRESPYIGQAVAYGDGRKFVSALVTIDLDHVRRWAAAHGVNSVGPDELAQHPAVRELIDREIAAANRSLASYESVKKFRILPRELTIADGDLTPTLKIRRKVVYAKYADLLDEMYHA